MKILIVEDDLQALARYRDCLGKDHEIIEATNVRDARIALCENHNIGLVVLDGIVPKYAGERPLPTFEFIYEIEIRLPNTPIIAASSDDGVNEQLVERGCTGFIRNKYWRELDTIIRALVKTAK